MSMNKTGISWAQYTWNFLIGCSHVSEGCRHCYAEQLALRHHWTPAAWTAQNADQNVRYRPDKVDEPRKVRQGARIFVNSMSDTFHPRVSDQQLDRPFETMRDCPQHQFLILTKRIARAAAWPYFPDNAWLGTSIENQAAADRLEFLKAARAKIKFVSFEPLLGPIDTIDLTGIQWVIIGGESGAHYRPMQMSWVRDLRDQAVSAGAAVFFKQDASIRPGSRPYIVEADGRRRRWEQFPDQPLAVPVEDPPPAANQLTMF